MNLRTGSILSMALAVVAILFPGTNGEATKASQQAPSAELIVTTAWLAEHLDDPNVVVLATGSQQDFDGGHIPGAGFVSHGATIGSNHGIPEPGVLAERLTDAGARDDARIVIYGKSAMELGWFYMAFASIGHGDHVSMLSGNIEAWRSDGRDVSTHAADLETGRLTPRPAPDVIVDAAWVKDRLENPDVQVLDVRSQRERDGGYLPGSELVLWRDLFANVEEMRFKPKDEIQALLVEAGLAPGQEVVTYCAVGMRASLMYFAARYVGVPSRVYLGSWNDWRRQSGYPITGGGN